MSTPVQHEHHIVGPKTYLLILLALLVLTATTTGAAFINMGIFSPIVALGIACFKAVLVILFFHAYPLQLEGDDAHRGCGVLHFPGVDYDDAVRLHQP